MIIGRRIQFSVSAESFKGMTSSQEILNDRVMLLNHCVKQAALCVWPKKYKHGKGYFIYFSPMESRYDIFQGIRR